MPTSWKRLLADDRVTPHHATREELEALRAAVQRDLSDAALRALSPDNRFGLAYEAALLVARMAIACAGYRVKPHDGHRTTFTALPLALGPAAGRRAAYFDQCRRKRHLLSYEYSGVVSEAEAGALLVEVRALRDEVETWIGRKYPSLARAD